MRLVGCRLAGRRRRATAPARAIDAELPQLLDLLAAASSAGLSAQLALRRAADALAGPLARSSRRAFDAVDLGARWRDELAALPTASARQTSAGPSRPSPGPRRWGSSLADSTARARERRAARTPGRRHRARPDRAGEDAVPARVPRPPRLPPPHGGAGVAHHLAVHRLRGGDHVACCSCVLSLRVPRVAGVALDGSAGRRTDDGGVRPGRSSPRRPSPSC